MTIRQTLTVLFSLALTAVFTGCPSPDKGMSYLERALAAAGPNRAELEKVLVRYAARPEDSLKYRAAVFLIENMPGHTYYRGEQLDNYLEYYAILPEAISSGRGSAAAVDTIRTRYGALDLSSLEHLSDIGTVDSAYLCSNIDWAFKVWEEQPWCRNVSFGDFCEYILPYRVGNETLAEWREDYYAEYNGVLDSLRRSPGKDDPLQAAQVIASYIDRTVDCSFTMDAPASLPNIGPEADAPEFVLYEQADAAAEAEADSKKAARDKAVAELRTYYSDDYLEKTYNLPPGALREEKEPEENAPASEPKKPEDGGPSFAEPEPALAEALRMQEPVDAFSADLSPAFEAMLAPVLDRLSQSGDYSEKGLADAIAAEYPRMDLDGLADMLARARFVCRLWGYING